VLGAGGDVSCTDSVRAGGTASHINDGDSFTCVAIDRGSFRVRFAGMDAPETGQAWSRRAQQAFAPALHRDVVEVHCYKTD
jgi:endonuclease YncB( thermonuclease family)